MKQIILSCIVTVLFLLSPMTNANAQEKQQKKLHIILEENGKVTKDTSLIFDKTVPEHEIQEIISGITGEASHPCPAQVHRFVHSDTLIHKCKHLKKGELDSLLEASGRPYIYIHSDSCRHGSTEIDSHVIWTEKVEVNEGSAKNKDVEIILMEKSTGKEPVIIAEDDDIIIIKKSLAPGKKGVKVISEYNADTLAREKIKEIKIIEIEDEDTEMFDSSGEKVIEKKIIITDEGDKAEKTIIMESPEKTEKSKQKSK